MSLKYLEAPDVNMLVEEMIDRLKIFCVVYKSIHCYRSRGSKSKRIIARIHGARAFMDLEKYGKRRLDFHQHTLSRCFLNDTTV
jgi:predicted metallopeptidase